MNKCKKKSLRTRALAIYVLTGYVQLFTIRLHRNIRFEKTKEKKKKKNWWKTKIMIFFYSILLKSIHRWWCQTFSFIFFYFILYPYNAFNALRLEFFDINFANFPISHKKKKKQRPNENWILCNYSDKHWLTQYGWHVIEFNESRFIFTMSWKENDKKRKRKFCNLMWHF